MTLKIEEPARTTRTFRGRCQDTGHTLEITTDRFQDPAGRDITANRVAVTIPCSDILDREDLTEEQRDSLIEERLIEALEKRINLRSEYSRLMSQFDAELEDLFRDPRFIPEEEWDERFINWSLVKEWWSIEEELQQVKEMKPCLPKLRDYLEHDYDVEGHDAFLSALSAMNPEVEAYESARESLRGRLETYKTHEQEAVDSLKAKFQPTLDALRERDEYGDVSKDALDKTVRAERRQHAIPGLPDSVRADLVRLQKAASFGREAAAWVQSFDLPSDGGDENATYLLQGAKKGYSMKRAYRLERSKAVGEEVAHRSDAPSLLTVNTRHESGFVDIDDEIHFFDEKASPSPEALKLLSVIEDVIGSESPHIDPIAEPEVRIVFSRTLPGLISMIEESNGLEAVVIRDAFYGAPDLYLVPAGGHVE